MCSTSANCYFLDFLPFKTGCIWLESKCHELQWNVKVMIYALKQLPFICMYFDAVPDLLVVVHSSM